MGPIPQASINIFIAIFFFVIFFALLYLHTAPTYILEWKTFYCRPLKFLNKICFTYWILADNLLLFIMKIFYEPMS
jgi:hypothetical protein